MPDTRPQIGDAFGLALRECYDAGMKPGVLAPIIERDDGFIQQDFDASRYFAPFEQWSELDRWLIDGVGGRVLDVGAGGGRAAVELQARGCDVVALDVSPVCVDLCRDRGVEEAFTGTIEEFTIGAPEPFDAFVLLGNGMGLMRDARYAASFLRLLASMAKDGAVIAGGCLDPYQTADSEHLAYHQRNRDAGRMAGQVRLRIRYRGVATPWWEYLFMSLDELQGLVAGSQWKIDDVKEAGAIYGVRLRLR